MVIRILFAPLSITAGIHRRAARQEAVRVHLGADRRPGAARARAPRRQLAQGAARVEHPGRDLPWHPRGDRSRRARSSSTAPPAAGRARRSATPTEEAQVPSGAARLPGPRGRPHALEQHEERVRDPSVELDVDLGPVRRLGLDPLAEPAALLLGRRADEQVLPAARHVQTLFPSRSRARGRRARGAGRPGPPSRTRPRPRPRRSSAASRRSILGLALGVVSGSGSAASFHASSTGCQRVSCRSR